MQKRVAYFDFDHTIINCDSDTYYIKELVGHEWSHEMRDHYRHHDLTWPQIVSLFSRRLLDEKHFSVHDVRKSLQTIVIPQEMQQVFHNLKKQNTTLFILSDANEKFIEWILDANQCLHYFDTIHSNHAQVASTENGDYLQVQPHLLFQSEPHKCQIGCETMCKGYIVNKLQAQHQFAQSYYFGDGGNDYCPCSKLQNGDICFVREGYHLQEAIAKKNGIVGKVVLWKQHNDLLQHVNQIFG